MDFFKREHIFFSLAYSFTVFVGLNLTGFIPKLRFAQELFWMAGGAGMCAYRPIIGANPRPTFLVMALATLTGLIAASYLGSVIFDEIVDSRVKFEKARTFLK